MLNLWTKIKQNVENRPFKTKLILIIMFISIISLVITGTTIIVFNNYSIKENMIENMSAISKLISNRSTAALIFQDSKLAEENLSVLNTKPGVISACLYNETGKIFAKYLSDSDKTIIFPEYSNRSGFFFDNQYLNIYEPVFLQGKRIGTLFIHASLNDLYTQKRDILVLVVIIILFSSIVAFFLSSSLHYFVSRPLLKLTKTVQVISIKNDYSLRAERYSNDEIGFLVSAFNLMLDTIENQSSEKRKLIEELRNHKENLEQLVKLRTSELEREKERAESADRLKSAFLATMSHELRTPLNSIIGFTGILLKGLAGPLNEEQTKQLKMAKGSGQHLLALINDVLDISKIEAGELVVASHPFDIASSIRKVVSVVQPMADKKGLELKADISFESLNITSDQRRVEQIFLNVVNNAIKFTETGFVKIKSDIRQDCIISQIEDSGIGMAAEDIDRIFKPFSQIDTGITRNHEGTGLGLSISKKLIEKLGGNIGVESRPGIGSTFTLTLPLEGA